MVDADKKGTIFDKVDDSDQICNNYVSLLCVNAAVVVGGPVLNYLYCVCFLSHILISCVCFLSHIIIFCVCFLSHIIISVFVIPSACLIATLSSARTPARHKIIL